MNSNYPDPSQYLYLLPVFLGIGLVMAIIMLIPYWQIFKKAGFTPWLALLMVVPMANLIVLYVVAFMQWKVAPVRPYFGGQPGQPAPGYPPLPPQA